MFFFDSKKKALEPACQNRGGRAWAEIDLDALQANVRAIRAALEPEARLLAVVKADAYGHGLIPVAQAAGAAGVAWMGVATVAEGVALREAEVETPIALLCPALPEEAEAIVAHRLTAAVGDYALLDAIKKAVGCWVLGVGRWALGVQDGEGEGPEIHLDIDTGIGRSGVLPEEAVGFWKAATQAGLRVTGLMTHFADADGSEESFSLQQRAVFRRVRKELEAAGARFDTIHLSNSSATRWLGASDGNLVRPGLLMYGILPAIPASTAPPQVRPCLQKNASLLELGEETGASVEAAHSREDAANALALRPVLALKARVATVRALPAGHSISYGVTHRLTRPSRVATVLIGYGDGYPRRLSNRGWMLLRGQRAPILGRVCMDQTVVDVTDIPGVAPGEEAVCIGAQGAESLRVEEMARLIETTEHEITTCLTPRIPRYYLAAK